MLKRLLDPKAVIFFVAVANMVQCVFSQTIGDSQTTFFSHTSFFFPRYCSSQTSLEQFPGAVLTESYPFFFYLIFEVVRLANYAEVSPFGSPTSGRSQN